MAEFVAELGEHQGDAEGQCTTEAEQMREGGKEALPVAGYQEQAEAQHQRQADPQQAWAVALEPGPGAIEKGIRSPQRNTEEQILMQRTLPQALALGGSLARIAGALLGIRCGDQVVLTQETQ
ncbi:hypothetical protein FQZ97_788080 [compost metagenome]